MTTQSTHQDDGHDNRQTQQDFYSPDLGDPDVGDHIVRPINGTSCPPARPSMSGSTSTRWVDWLRRAYGLPPAILPPLWHRHDVLVWELSALHLHWLNSYDPDASPSAPLAWHRDLADARHWLREWVATSGTRLDRDRPMRLTAWPGDPPTQPEPEAVIANRDEDFVAFVLDDLRRRRPDPTPGDAEIPGILGH